MTTYHIGFGRFHLEQFALGDEFRRYDGSLCRLCAKQPYQEPQPLCNHPYMPDHLMVWVDIETSNARQMFFHRHALVHAVTREQARTIEARSKCQKGGTL